MFWQIFRSFSESSPPHPEHCSFMIHELFDCDTQKRKTKRDVFSRFDLEMKIIPAPFPLKSAKPESKIKSSHNTLYKTGLILQFPRLEVTFEI
jgi:hypothetical protein